MTCEAWPIAWPCDINGVDPDIIELATAAAQSLLWATSGRRLGVCDYADDVWPSCSCGCGGGPYKDASGAWRNSGGFYDCCRLMLAHRPIVAVTSVAEHGIDLDPAAYSWSATYLRRQGSCWPCADDCDDPPVRVVYTAGVPLPGSTALAMGEVACEFVAGFSGNPCKLPSRAITVARQGVTVELQSPDETIAANRIGLPIADAWLRVANPNGLTRTSRVYSPDHPRSTPVRT